MAGKYNSVGQLRGPEWRLLVARRLPLMAAWLKLESVGQLAWAPAAVGRPAWRRRRPG
jgi:hypothetical protein